MPACQSSVALRPLLALVAVVAACAPAPATQPAPVVRRAIVVSFDALNERRMLQTVDPAAVPAFRALFTGGACADGARPAFPSVTSPGHASLWTGAYGDVNGVAANSQPVLPRPEHTLLESISGYSAEALRAEPIWLTAVASGLTTFGHQVTQAPGAPGYVPVAGSEPRLDSMRAAARALLARPGISVVNGYNRQIAPDLALTESIAPTRAASGWTGLERLRGGVAPREIAWAVGDDSIFALLHGVDRYDRVLVARARDASGGVIAVAAPVEQAPLAGRELGRHFSPPLTIPVTGGHGYLRARLFEVSPDGMRYLLFVPELRVVEGNRPEVAAAYDAAVEGWYGNGAIGLTERGAFGRTLWEGGDGTAEMRYLETAELVTRQFERGSAWGWNSLRPALMLDYFPLIDEADHMLFGHVVAASPLHHPAVAARVQGVRARAWALADHRLAALRALVGDDPNAAIFVGGDHGMRATWRTFRPNVALAAAGLLALDSAGRIDLTRTRALSPNGYWVTVNRTAWKGGIVPPAEEAAVLARAARALEDARGPDGRPIVTRLWRAAEHDSLGMGGPVGGELYYEVAGGYRWSSDPRGAVASESRAGAGHGYPSGGTDMQTVLCAAGAGIAPRRLGSARTVDMAPTVAAWLGMRPPAQSVGRSLLGEMLGR
ncbi:MAG: alkaline phosphatase family protein [Gemmatimonadaceae bacterium]